MKLVKDTYWSGVLYGANCGMPLGAVQVLCNNF